MARTLITLGWLPMVIYPFVALADLMSLAGDTRGSVGLSKLTLITAKIFLYGSLAYPLVFFPCRDLAKRSLNSGHEQDAVKISAIPVLYVLVMVALVMLWASRGNA